VRVSLPEDVYLVSAFLQPPDPLRMHGSVVEMQFPVRRRGADG
jgi:hypothetical protein